MKEKLFFGEKKHAIRAAGLKTEKKFFGPRGVFAKAGHTKHLKQHNPQYRGPMTWQAIVDYVGHEGWKPFSKKNVAAFSRNIGTTLFQVIQLEARAWRVLYRTFLTPGADPMQSLGTYAQLDSALIAANRQASEWTGKKKNPPTFEYQDARGVWHIGVMEKYVDHGGSDHTAFMRRSTGELDLVSGSRLKNMKVVTPKKNPITVVGNPRDKFTLLSHGIYAVSDRTAGELARQSKSGRLPNVGREIRVTLPSGKEAWLTRQKLTMLDSVKNKRGWVWAVHHFSEAGGAPIPFGKSYGPNPRENPPKRIRANVEGVMYNKVWEVQAEKTGEHEHKGFWYHPYKSKSQVQMLALDSGDILLHSRNGTKLWKED